MSQTNMKEVKCVAKWLLFTDVHTTEYSPMIVHHPFASSGFMMLPGTNEILDITASMESREKWRDYLGKKIDEAKTAYEIFLMLNKTYALTFIKYAKDGLSAAEFSEILADAWIKAEAPNMDVNVSKTELVGLFNQADKQSLMTEDEQKRFADLTETVTVYRGVTSYNAKNVRALSWTLDRSKAEWFAHRFGEDGKVYQAQIKKADILAIFTSRNESEVVLNPRKLQQLKAV
jgi:hypothetical protein